MRTSIGTVTSTRHSCRMGHRSPFYIRYRGLTDFPEFPERTSQLSKVLLTHTDWDGIFPKRCPQRRIGGFHSRTGRIQPHIRDNIIDTFPNECEIVVRRANHKFFVWSTIAVCVS